MLLKQAGFQSLTPSIKSAIINFVYDGNLPPLVQGSLFSSLQNRAIVMTYGIYLMEQMNVSIEKSVREAYNSNQQQIQSMLNSTKTMYNFSNFFK